MKMTVTVDLHSVKSERDIMVRFADVLGLDGIHGNSWDAFYDEMRSLNTQSRLVRESADTITGIHLTVNGLNAVADKVSEKAYSMLCETLAELTDRSQRYDHFDFTFTVALE